MSDFSKVDPVISGADYTVQIVNGRKPQTLDDFTAHDVVTFVAVCGSQTTQVCGSSNVVGDTVVVHEKTEDGAGKDVRMWSISPNGDSFEAVSPPAH